MTTAPPPAPIPPKDRTPSPVAGGDPSDPAWPPRSRIRRGTTLGVASVASFMVALDLLVITTDAWERGDVDALVAMLADDATFSMPPYPTWYRGRADIAAFLTGGPMREQWRLVPLRANGQVAFGCFRLRPGDHSYAAHSLDVITLAGPRIGHVTAFLDDSVPGRFGLPRVLPSG